MKKNYFFVSLLAFTIFMGTAQSSDALVVSCVNCSTFWDDIKSYLVQGTQLSKETISSFANTATMVSTAATQINQVVFRPLQDALMLATILKSSNQIKTLVLGGVGGDTSLLITNPELYIKQKGVESLKIQAGQVAKADGVYSNSILNSMVTIARINSDTAGTLASLSKSSIPKTVQTDLCSDAKLESIAINDVTGSDGTYDITAMRARKTEIYNKLCTGDPNNDKALAQALITAGNQTGAGGWGTWLAATNGDNEFTKKQLALALVERERIAKEGAKAADLARGSGVISKTECLLKVPNQATGGTDCVDEAITQSGSQLNSALRSAINAPLDVLKNAYGTGGAASSFGNLLSGIASILGSVNSIRNSVNAVSGQAQSMVYTPGSGGDPRLQVTLAGSNPPRTLGTVVQSGTVSNTPRTPDTVVQSGIVSNTPTGRTSYEQDLAGKTKAKEQLIKPILDMLTQHTKVLASLETSDASYLDAITEYSGYIEGVGACYQKLITDFPAQVIDGTSFASLANDKRVVDAMAYYSSRKTTTGALKTQVTTEISLIGTTRTLVSNTRTSITNSNSSDEISDTFDSYNATVENNNLPSVTTGVTRDADVITYKSNTASEIQNFAGTENAANGGKITKLNDQCAAIRPEEQAKRDAARQNPLNNVNSNGI